MKTLRKLVVLIQYGLFALKRINRPHIGDIVIYKGKSAMLIQGAMDPYWSLMQDNERVDKVHVSEFKLMFPINGRVERFRESLKFQMGYWYLIDTNKSNLFNHISYRSS